jgi:hypothetical protein
MGQKEDQGPFCAAAVAAVAAAAVCSARPVRVLFRFDNNQRRVSASSCAVVAEEEQSERWFQQRHGLHGVPHVVARADAQFPCFGRQLKLFWVVVNALPSVLETFLCYSWPWSKVARLRKRYT